MMRMLGLVAVLVVVGLGVATPAWAADVTVTAQLQKERVYVGDSTILQFTVDGAQEAEAPDLSKLDGLQAQFLGGQDSSSHSTFIVNGRRTEQSTLRYVMQYRLTPTRAGQLMVPGVPVTVAGKTYRANAVSLMAQEPGDNPDFKLKLEAEKTTAYVGEPVKVRVVWYLGKQPRGPQFAGNDGGDVYDIFPGADPRPPGTAQDDRRYPAVPFLGGQVVGLLGQGELDGKGYTTLTVEEVVIPRKSGTLKVGPFSVAFDAVTGQRQQSFFDAPWDDRSITERVALTSNVVSLEVRELPEAGRPADFNGLVGSFGVEAAAGLKEANVGDPIPLTVKITGPEPLDRVKAPELEEQPGLVDGFKTSPEGWEAQKDHRPGERVFTTTVRAKSDKVKEIPGIGLSFFDTGSGAYRTATSAPIPLNVHPSREVTVADAVGGGGLSAPVAVSKKGLQSAGGGLRANDESDDVLRDERFDLGRMFQRPGWIVVLAGPPLACAVLAGVRRRSGRDDRGARRRRALGAARGTLRYAASLEAVSLGVRSYVGGALGAEGRALTSADCRRLLHEAGSVRAEQVEQLVAECERGVYGRAGRSAEELRGQALALVADVDRELRRAG
jgi:hypothetical protein